MTLRAIINMQQTVVETEAGEFVNPNNRDTTTDGLNSTFELTESTTPPITKQSAGRATLVAGAATIDLTSLPDKNGTPGAVTFLGLKVNCYKFSNPGANALTITFGAANPYLLHGSAFKIILLPGEEIQFKGNDLGPDVTAGAKNIDVAGTLAQYLEYHFGAG